MSKEHPQVPGDSAAVSRREVLVLASEAALATALVGCGGGGATEGACVGAGTGAPMPGAEKLAVGEAGLFPQGSADALFIIARDEQGFMAMKNYCTHSGCGLRIMPDKTYLCDCHGSSFKFDGTLVVGPATRALDHVAMCRRSDGVLMVDKTKTLPDLASRVK